MTLTGIDAVGGINLRRSYRVFDSDSAYAMELAAVVGLGVLEGRWKVQKAGGGTSMRRLFIAHGGGTPVSMRAQFESLAEWSEMRRQLLGLPGVEDLRIEAESARGADLTLRFPGGANELASALYGRGLALENGCRSPYPCAQAPTKAISAEKERQHVRDRDRLNLPNLITLGRVILVPVVFWLLITGQTEVAFVAFIIAGISDAVDGYLAKTFGWKTELGAYLDPLADKLLIVSIFLALGVDGKLPLWLVIAVVSRDILIVIAVMLSWLLGNPDAHPPADRQQGQHGCADRAGGDRSGRRRLRARARTWRASC